MMDFLEPVFVGAGINLAVYAIVIFVLKSQKSSIVALFSTTFSTLLVSFFIGGFTGMGIGVIALGMFTVPIIISLVIPISKKIFLNTNVSSR